MPLFDWNRDWSLIDQGEKFSWEVKTRGRENLRKITPVPDHVFEGPSSNRDLRVFLRKYLRKSPLEISRWIAADWGGIRTHNPDKFSELVGRFGSFSEEGVRKAVNGLSFDRISTWSKLAAFAYPEDYAIFDARTAAALNCVLKHRKKPERFYIPRGRNKVVSAITSELSATPSKSLTYFDYICALKAAVTSKRSLLDVEMTIFANSEKICLKYARAI